MLRALESMRTKEELCDYLKSKGIKNTEKVAENLKQIYNNSEIKDKILSLKQLEQVAGGIFCEFGSGFFDEPQFSFKEGYEGSFTLKMDCREKVFSMEKIDSMVNLSQRHSYIFEKFMQWVPSQFTKEEIHKITHNPTSIPQTYRSNPDKLLMANFLYKHLSPKSKQLLSVKKQKTSKPNLSSNEISDKTQADKEFEIEKKIVFSILLGVAYIGLSYLILKGKQK